MSERLLTDEEIILTMHRAKSEFSYDKGLAIAQAQDKKTIDTLRMKGIPGEMMELQPNGEQKRIKGRKVFIPDEEEQQRC